MSRTQEKPRIEFLRVSLTLWKWNAGVGIPLLPTMGSSGDAAVAQPELLTYLTDKMNPGDNGSAQVLRLKRREFEQLDEKNLKAEPRSIYRQYL